MAKNILTPQSQDFPSWYVEVVNKAELADNGPVRGTQMIRPWGYAIWENMQAEMDQRIKEQDALNVAFPLFIPMEYIEKESEHVDGFSPELAVVTHGGGKELTEPIAVRPTSETLFGEYMSKFIQSYRDLPMLLNQWCNIVRWEKRTRLFLRSSEFIWQEGHTAHATKEDASEYANRIHNEVYKDFMNNVLACPVFVGEKTKAERFPGAIKTIACEAMMRNTKALQMSTSHELGQNFSKAFDISFSDKDGELQHAWTTSWGASTRMIGGTIMCHGDDRGLRLPPKVAPLQVIIIAINDRPEVLEAVNKLKIEIKSAGFRCDSDIRTDLSFGRRAVDWELKGVPIRIEIGPRDLEENKATITRRDTGNKDFLSLDAITGSIQSTLENIHNNLFEEANTFKEKNTHEVKDTQSAIEVCQNGFAKISWDILGVEGEKTLANEAITVRCLQTEDGQVPKDTDDNLIAIVAKSY